MWRVMWPPLEAHWLASVIIESKFSLHGVISMPDIWIMMAAAVVGVMHFILVLVKA